MLFKCSYQNKNMLEKWTGKIINLENYGSHYEMRIESRSGIIVLFGKTTYGNFACLPDYGVGCHLAKLNDIFYNTERLINVTNPIDAITVAKALKTFAEHYGNSNCLKSKCKGDGQYL